MDTQKPLKRWQRKLRVTEIHELAEEQLKSPVDGFDYRAHLTELHRIEFAKKSLPDLEARIMLLLGEQKRQARVRQLLAQLRNRRELQGESAEFEAFEARLKGYLGTDALIGHDFLPETFTTIDHDLVWENVGNLIEQLGELSSGVFLNSGTLLGVTRDRRLIDHDDDVDLAFCLHATAAKSAAAEWVALRNTLIDLDIFDHAAKREPMIHKLRSEGGYHIDLFPCWTQGGKVYVYPHTCGDLTVGDVFPTKQCKVTGLPVPSKPTKMLALNYGADWRKPDPYFRFNWTRANERFESFAREVEALEARVSRGDKPFGTILTYGTFDLFHVGHVRLLRRLSALGERLVVGVSTDEFNAQKGKTSVMSYHDRAEILSACEYVSEVIPETTWEQKRQDIARVGADVFAMGDDWAGKFDDLSDLCQVLYLPRTENISSTDVKASVVAAHAPDKDIAV